MGGAEDFPGYPSSVVFVSAADRNADDTVGEAADCCADDSAGCAGSPALQGRQAAGETRLFGEVGDRADER